MAKKHVRAYKKCLATILPICLLAGVVVSTATLTAVILQNKEAPKRPIPDWMLDLSNDGTILYGFRPEYTNHDIENYRSLIIPETVTTIAPFAFMYAFDGICNKISEIKLNSSLETIGQNAFAHCTGLKRVNFSELYYGEDTKLSRIEKEAFFDCTFTSPLAIPNTVKYIGDSCFELCINTGGRVLFPNQLEYIGKRVFARCYRMHEIDLSMYNQMPFWLKEKKELFLDAGQDDIKRGKAIFIPTNLQGNTFSEWQQALFLNQKLPNIAEVSSGFSIDYWKQVPEHVFDVDLDTGELKGFDDTFDLSELSKYNAITIPANVKKILPNAFTGQIKNCNLNFNISINEITDIGKEAFKDCTGLTGSLDFNTYLENINENAFEGCTGIESIYLSSSIKEIKNKAFFNCSGLKTLYIDVNDESKIDANVFSGCKALHTIDLSSYSDHRPEGWMLDEERTNPPFSNISPTGMFIVNEDSKDKDWFYTLFNSLGINTTASESFAEGKYWQEVPPTSTELPVDYFEFSRSGEILLGLTASGEKYKGNYQNIIIPSGTEYIINNAFDCRFAQPTDNIPHWKLHLNFGLKQILAEAFRGCTGFYGTLSFPNDLTYIGDYAFYNCCRFRSELIFPETVEYIGDAAFYNCALLTSSNLVLPKNLKHLGNNPFALAKIDQITFNENLESVGDLAVYGIQTLQKINLTDCTFAQVSSWEHTASSFSTWRETGEVIVNSSATPGEWDALLHNEFGLPAGWTITQV